VTEAIETEQTIPLLTPTAEDVFSDVNKRKLFKTRSAMTDFINMGNSVAGQFRLHVTPTGDVWELVYVNRSEDN
jgi:hypothetical protein